MTTRRLAALAVLAASTIVLAACSGGDGSGDGDGGTAPRPPATAGPDSTTTPTTAPGDPGPPPTAAPDDGRERVALPDVTVRDVAAGADVDLAALLPSDRPLLAWFWAPH